MGLMRPIPAPLAALCLCAAAQQPLHEAELIFPLEHWHNHASSIVELPDGELFTCWYHGSGERTADDVKVEAARRPRGRKQWNPRFTLADTPAFPDCNPALFLDAQKRLWLLWPVILANEWHTALMKYRISSDYRGSGPPRWQASDSLLFIPRDFQAKVKQVLEPLVAADPAGPRAAYLKQMLQRAGDKYFSRMGWMTRAHPLQLPSGRILVPLYSDGYDFSLIAISDDGGVTWTTSEPLVGAGSVQPTLVRRRDGALAAYFRDNGPPPKRLQVTSSSDNGVTWTLPKDTDFPNPGAGAEVIRLRNGNWALVYNDLERGRYSLAVTVSDDEGQTWKWTRHLEKEAPSQRAGSYHYPSIIEARDGLLHASYSYFLPTEPGAEPRKSIKHAAFNLEWVKEGDKP